MVEVTLVANQFLVHTSQRICRDQATVTAQATVTVTTAQATVTATTILPILTTTKSIGFY